MLTTINAATLTEGHENRLTTMEGGKFLKNAVHKHIYQHEPIQYIDQEANYAI